jgi:hypothetical protein
VPYRHISWKIYQVADQLELMWTFASMPTPKGSFTIDKKAKFMQGDLVKILDDHGNILDYGYLIKDMWEENGMPLVRLKTQRTDKTLEMVLTNAIKKV